jgi:Histidine kinase
MDVKKLPPWQPSLLILSGYWVYVTVTNLLYAWGMGISIAKVTSAHVFAPWSVRVAQHLLLLPILLLFCGLSLRIGWRPAWRRVPWQLLLALAFGIVAQPILELAEVLTGNSKPQEMHPNGLLVEWFDLHNLALWSASAVRMVLSYAFGVALITGFAIYRRYRDAELRVAALEREWSSARLSALRMQLSPHTLFNLLNTIRGNIAWDPEGAQAMIVQLADLLRRLLNAGERDFSVLADELHFVRLYLQLQQKRFSDRLRIVLPEPQALPVVWVPSLILQPLVENAVVHGLAGHSGPTEVRVDVHMDGDRLTVRVTNTAVVGGETREGIGLRNVRERLAVHFGTRAEFVSKAIDAQHWEAVVQLPVLREAEAGSRPMPALVPGEATA